MRGAAAFLFLGVLLAACSGSDHSAPTLPTPSQTQVAPTPVAASAGEQSSPLPSRDLMDLGHRLRDVPVDTPRDAPPRQEPLSAGRDDTFWVVRVPGAGEARQTPPHAETITAALRLVTASAYIYVQDGVGVDSEKVDRAGRVFEEVYPKIHGIFGRERSPGIDGDPRVTVLLASLPNVGGYVSGDDEYPRAVSPLSNEREMVYLDVSTLVSDDVYTQVLSHELQHLVHFGADPDEENWVQEGLSVTAQTLGRDLDTTERAFLKDPDVQLNAWDPQGYDEPHYGAAGLFFRYLTQRASDGKGPAVLKDLVSEPADGIDGVEAFLKRDLPGVSFRQLFADWATANYLDLQDGGPYGYPNISVKAEPSKVLNGPSQGEDTVHQFAADYIEVDPVQAGTVFSFQGDTTVAALSTGPHSGRGLWWSNRGDAIDTTLTRELDLTGLSSATLTFWTWYDIERWYDYGYVEVSTNGGDTWQVLPGQQTADENPLSLAYGPGYTGTSGGGDQPSWVQEQIDLTPFAGRRVLLRFEYVTDEGLNLPGWAIDDIAVPELRRQDEAESAEDWEARGFQLLTGPLPQTFIVRLIETGSESRVTDVALNADNHAEIRLPGPDAGVTKDLILIAATTDGTSEAAHYRYSLAPSP